ncbi:MAG: hypothetical protein ACRCR9_00060 [Chitinophagaceae bacterium]
MDSISSRIPKIIENKGINISSFEKKISVANNTISTAIRRNSNLSGEIINKIVLSFPDINPEWLLTGKGCMLRDAQPSTTPSLRPRETIPATPSPELLAENTQLKVQVQLLESHNKELKEHIEDLRSSNQYFQKILNQATVVEVIKEDVSQKHKLKTTH